MKLSPIQQLRVFCQLWAVITLMWSEHIDQAAVCILISQRSDISVTCLLQHGEHFCWSCSFCLMKQILAQ